MIIDRIGSTLRKGLAVILALIICSQVVVYGIERASAESKSKDKYLASAEIPEGLDKENAFYLGSNNGEIEENYTGSYILKVARGGDAKDKAKVDLKISDLTAKYGTDYRVRIKSDSILNGEEANSPQDNESLFEMVDGTDIVSDDPVTSDDEKSALYESMGKAAYSNTATPDEVQGVVRDSSNPLKSAKEAQLGEKSDRADMTSSKQDVVDMVNNATNTVTNLVKGATLTVNFEKGEKEKYVEIVTIDNEESDGDRIFYINLSNPTKTYYCGKVCEAAITIKDDEPLEKAEISFDKVKYNADEDSVTVVVKRSGAIKQVATAVMTSEAISARSGIDFQPVNSEVMFPMGIKERTLTISVNSAYITSKKSFALKLSAESEGVKIGENSKTVVTINPLKNNNIVTPQADSKRTLNTCDYTDKYTFKKDYNSKKVRGSSNDWSTSENGDGYLRLRTYDDSWLDVKVSLSGTSDFSNYYCYDGIELVWQKIGARSTWTKTDVTTYTSEKDENKTTLWSGKNERWDPCTDHYNFGRDSVSAVKFYLMNDGGNKNYLDIRSMKFLKRHFNITVEDADPLSFYTGDGTKTAKNERATRTKINGLADNERTTLKYADEELVISVPQDAPGYGNLTGLKLKSKSGSSYIDIPSSYYTTNGGTAITLKFTKAFVNNYHDYIDFTKGSSNRYVGNLTIKPVFSYVKTKIIVHPNESFAEDNNGAIPGHLTINGKVIDTGKDLSSTKTVTLTYDAGDTLKFSSTMYDDVRYRMTGINKKYLDRNEGVYKDIDDNFVDTTAVMTVNGVTTDIMPNFGLADNCATIVISKDDLSHFEKFGMLSDSFIKSATLKNNYYYIKAIKPEQMHQNMEYLFNVKPLNGYQPVWKVINTPKYYQTHSFTFRPTSKKDENKIYLFAGKESSDYVSMKGQLYYENYMISGKKIGYPIMPIKDGGVELNGEMFMTDSSGNINTNAMHTVASITDNGNTVTFGNGKTTLYGQVRMLSAWRAENYDFTIDYSSSKKKVSNGTTNVDSYVIDFGQFTLDTNSEYGPTAKDIYIKNGKENADQVLINGSPTTINVSFNNIPSDGIKKVEFHILDPVTFEKKATYEAMSNDGNYYIMETFDEEGVANGDYQVGDLVYVQVTTNEELDFDTTDESQRIKETTYAPIYTGYVLSRTDAFKDPVMQTIDMGDIEGYGGFPILGDFGLNLNLGKLSLSTEKLYDNEGNTIGTRIHANMALDFEKTRKATENHGKDFNGNPNKNIFQKLANMKDTLSGVADAFNQIRDAGKSAGKYKDAVKNAAKFGKPDFAVYPVVGLYLDFNYHYKYDDHFNLISKDLQLIGGGVHLGVALSFKVTWYAFIPVVYIPVFFGVNINAQLYLEAGGTRSYDLSEEETVYENYVLKSHNVTENLHGDFSLTAKGNIDIYAGVGVCGVASVRGGLNMTAGFLWYPTLAAYNEYFDSTGFDAGVNIAIWIDLVLFTLPITFNLAHGYWGLAEQYHELGDKSQDEIDEILKEKAQGLLGSGSSSEISEESADVKLKDRSNKPSSWNGTVNSVSPDEVKTMATYKEKNTTVLLRDGYDRPDTKLLDMGDKGTLMVFLQDNKSKSDEERTSICYTVYKDGKYSKPVVIQTDSTADFEPNVADAGDKVVITWTSSNPDKKKISVDDKNYSKEYLKSLEVYSVEVSKDDLADNKSIDQKTITQLTDDEFYDSQAYVVYDKTSGDYNIYYIKTAEDDEADAELFDFANPLNTSQTTYSVIAYRVNENGKGWLVDEFKEKEKPSAMTDDDFKMQLQALNGQRLLDSSIDTEGIKIDDPLIADFKAIGYNGIGVFTYTIDKDNNADTVDDRDLFIQLYDFETRSTYKPIRITNDNTTDALPQLIRNGSDENGTTYLFWLSGDELKYIDVSSLVKYGVDKDGKIKASALDDGSKETISDTPDENIYAGMTEKEIKEATYKFDVQTFVPADVDDSSEKSQHPLSSYKVAVDKDDNLYVIWMEDPEGTEGITQEIFASAMIKSEIKPEEGRESENVVKTWSEANQLTNFGLYCDEPAIAITEDNNMMMVYNRFDVDEKNATYKDMNLVSTILEPFGSVDATEITYSDNNPNVGDNVDVTINFKNTGLTASKNGFVAKIYERHSDGTKTLLETYDNDSSLVPSNSTPYTFTYIANDKTIGSDIYVTVKEKDLEGTTVNSGEKFINRAEYEITNHASYQGDDGKFYSDVTIKNIGNFKSEKDDKIQIYFNGQYGDPESYGVTETVLAEKVVNLEVGETESYTLPLDIPTEAMTKFGYADVLAMVVDKDYNEIAHNNCTMFMEKPTDLKLNSGKDIDMKKGDSIKLDFSYQTNGLLKPVIPVFTVEDNSVVTVKDNKLVAVGNGTTTVKALAMPYGSATEVKVTVGNAPKPAPKSVKLSKSKLSLYTGKTYKLTAKVSPVNANQSVKWSSSNTKIATVDAKGKITAKKAGTVKITATSKDNSKVKATCTVTVKQKAKSVKLNKKSVVIKKGKKYQLKATVSPKNTTNKALTWKSTNTKIATVSSKGKVTAKKKGKCYIKVTTKDGSKKSAKCKITVK